MKIPRIYLIGFMGSGKSTLGKQLASKLNREFIDIDFLIEDFTKKSIYDIFIGKGEQIFREIEQQILRKTINYSNAVIATGGGTACYYNNINWMNINGKTIYIKVAPTILYERLLNSRSNRPLIKKFNDVQLFDYVKNQLPERESFYKKAHYVIDSKSTTVNDIVKCL